MLIITYFQMLLLITLVWIAVRLYFIKKNESVLSKNLFLNEAKLLLVYICIIVIVRIVYFPWHHVDGKIGPLIFDKTKIFPPRVNLIPFERMFDIYPGRTMNIIGNISMFIPVGIVWPLCFKKLDCLWKTVLAGAAFSLFIEISQLAFYERCSDVDDLLMNASGVLIGAILYFGIKKFNVDK